MTLAARPSPLARAWSARWPIGAEIALFLALFVLYEWLRDLVAPASAEEPLRNAADVVAAERALGLYVEPAVHRWTEDTPGMEPITSWVYTLAYTGGFIAMFLWVWLRRRRCFAAFRNWFWATNGLAVIGYWVYPLAPPRLSDPEFSDPTASTLELGGAMAWFEPFRNEYAAMPSMHVGHTVLFGLALFWLLRPSPWRWLAWLWPAGMLYVVMGTANHWWLDGVGGAACVLLALALVHPLCRSLARPWGRRAPAPA